MKKRISSLLLIIMLLINCLPFQGVAAIGTPQYILDSETVQVGETFTMDVAIADNPGIISLRFKVSYDTEVLELKSVANSGILNGFTTPAPTITSPYTLRWADSLATTDNTAQGTVITLAFKALKVTNSSSVTIEHGEARNAMGTKVAFSNTTANVTVKEVPVNVIGVSLNKETLSLKTAESETLIATVSPNNATNKALSWKSEDNTIATVDNNGKVTAFKKGTTIVTVTTEDGSFTDTCEVSVACSHINQTPVTEKESDCKNQGWNAYAKCDDCGQLLSENGTTEIDEIPFRPLSEQHTGGTATCTAQAVCTVCGNSYGDLASHSYTATEKKTEALKIEGNCRDKAVYYYSCSACGKVENNDSHTFEGNKIATSHVGGTALVNQAEANHKTQTDGYTGDTKCLGCNEIIAYGQPIPANAHTPANIWSNDSEYHWKECTVVGCGIVIDGSKAPHCSDKTENEATCQKQAVCDVCGVSYGELASHNYTAENKKQNALKTEGNCRDKAVYYYSCSVCGLVENNDAHTFLGDKVATSHVGGTTLVGQIDANHKTQTDGYTGDTKCLGCNEIISYGEAIPAGAHIPASNWTTDGTYHWKVCTVGNCGIVIDSTRVEHTSTGANIATCKTQAKCDICDTAYGSLNANNHVGGTTLVNQAEANHKTQTDGYTGDTKCLGCNKIIDYGQPIPANAHTPANVWSNDSEYHWKECTIVGCGIVIDGSKASHNSDKTENKATCQKQAVCDVCNVSYGDFADHDWNTSSWEKDASGHWHKCNTAGCTEKNDFAGHTPDHQGGATEEYPIKCTVCQYEIEAQLGHTHVFDKEVADEKYLASKANCTEPAKYYKSCKCGEKGVEIFAFGGKLGHTEGADWKSDKDNHWHECSVAGCGVIIDSSKTAHIPNREAATENDPIKCSVCGYMIVPALGHTHSYSDEWKSNKDNHWNECTCGDKANTSVHKDDNKNGKCDVCEYEVGTVIPNPEDPNKPSDDVQSPETSDNGMMWVWIALLLVSGACVVAIRKKRVR